VSWGELNGGSGRWLAIPLGVAVSVAGVPDIGVAALAVSSNDGSELVRERDEADHWLESGTGGYEVDSGTDEYAVSCEGCVSSFGVKSTLDAADEALEGLLRSVTDANERSGDCRERAYGDRLIEWRSGLVLSWPGEPADLLRLLSSD
jgi:hypothetical protein